MFCWNLLIVVFKIVFCFLLVSCVFLFFSVIGRIFRKNCIWWFILVEYRYILYSVVYVGCWVESNLVLYGRVFSWCACGYYFRFLVGTLLEWLFLWVRKSFILLRVIWCLDTVCNFLWVLEFLLSKSLLPWILLFYGYWSFRFFRLQLCLFVDLLFKSSLIWLIFSAVSGCWFLVWWELWVFLLHSLFGFICLFYWLLCVVGEIDWL